MTDEHPPSPASERHEPLNPRVVAASAAADGAATDDEQALLARDTVATELAVQYSALARAIRTVDPPATGVAELNVAAALAEFDRQAVPAARQTFARFERTGWTQRAMAVAAAVLAIGVLGVVVTQLGTGSDDDSGVFDAAATATIDNAADDGADAATSLEAPQEFRASEAADDTADDRAGGAADDVAPSAESDGADAPVPSLDTSSGTMPVSTADELAAYATELLAAGPERSPTTVPAGDSTSDDPASDDTASDEIRLAVVPCLDGDDIVLGTAIVEFPGDPVAIGVAVVLTPDEDQVGHAPSAGRVAAVDPDGCAVVLETVLPR